MKKGSLLLAAFLLISGTLRMAGPGAAAPMQREKETQQKAKNEEAQKNPPKIPYLEKFAAEIEQFYGLEEGSSGKNTDLPSHFKALHALSGLAGQGPVQFVIAILPDPVHTRLGLSFDRGAEAIQQAAQMKRYVFDRAIMPWDRTRRSEATDLKTRQEDREEQEQRESYPGLMIFRANEAPGKASSQGDDSKNALTANPHATKNDATAEGPLFLLVVGETPTAGVNKAQFRHAVQIIENLRGTPRPAEAANQPLLILGPTFSGSLDSLGQELERLDKQGISSKKFIYSGSVTATGSMRLFEQKLSPGSYFASFQENDDYARDEFLQFAWERGYRPYEVAILSEDGTVFGAASRSQDQTETKPDAKNGADAQESLAGAQKPSEPPPLDQEVVKLHFPREISYFRSAYQKEIGRQASAASNPEAVSTLPTNAEEYGNDDGTVAPYAVQQTSLSQEAVMLGVVSELQKHHIKFTLLLASDPLDEIFLASYLRKAYAQGRVVITVPDLLFPREGDPALRGVLGLSAYALIPGLGDRLCRQGKWIPWHEDRLFVSSLSAGTFNAMVGLLSVEEEMGNGWNPGSELRSQFSPGDPGPGKTESEFSSGSVPYAPYAEYGSPNLKTSSATDTEHCEERPLLWLTILGRDGFWPVAGIDSVGLESQDRQIPIASLKLDGGSSSTLRTAADNADPENRVQSYGLLSLKDKWERKLGTPPAWNIAYCLCLILLMVHAIFSWTGSILADSEERAQFTRTTDCRGAIILALGAFALASAFVLVMCTRSPRADWVGFPGLTLVLWLAYPVFVGITIWDLDKLRGQRAVARVFLGLVCAMTFFQLLLAWIPSGCFRVYWSTRMLHITSGVSPVLPVLLLMAAGYWWTWMSLRGVCLVDLRRPRLPQRKDLPAEAYRISDAEGEDLRKTAHPLYFIWQIVIPVVGLGVIALLALGRDLPVQSVEGIAFDRGYTLILCLAVAAFLGCLMKLVQTWQKCHQVLAGLDRFPLRSAFSRMKNLSWHSFWNPGGSTLRETYKVMNRALENMTRLLGLVENWNTPMKESARYRARDQIRQTLDVKKDVFKTYSRILAKEKKKINRRHSWRERLVIWFQKDLRKRKQLEKLMRDVELLQKEMAKTGAILVNGMLKPLWEEDESPVVSSDEQIVKPPLPSYRAMAEEYVALVYVNFLVSVLLRIRTLVISAGGMYVFIVLSMNTYPFEPHPALQTLSVVLLLILGAGVGYVYAEMHREAILSRLTSTAPGELGLDFWVKFASAAAIPVFSLLASQFPSINQFLFSWLEPALQAMK
jgi:hypothetical protein